ncbi:MAG: DUF1992 domain-containing protein [Ilumatobacteraceae bacterium]
MRKWESAVEQQIKDGIARGEFDALPGRGKPIEGLSGDHDEDWWLKAKLRAERLSYLPPTIRIRKEVEEAREAMAAASNESVVRRIVDDINVKIRDINRRGAEGPPSTVMVLDPEAEVARWRAAQTG